MIAGFEERDRGADPPRRSHHPRLPPARRNVAMAFEGYSLYPPLTVRENIAFALLRDRLPRAEVQEKVAEIAKLLEIEDILDRYPPSISGGQQQRASLGRALVRDADLSCLTSRWGSSSRSCAPCCAAASSTLIKHKMTTVFVTHDQTEANALADRIAVMEEGVLQQFATPTELKERPANLFVGTFIGEPPMNVFEAASCATSDSSRSASSIDREQTAFDVALSDEAATTLPAVAEGRSLHLGVRPHRSSSAPAPGRPRHRFVQSLARRPEPHRHRPERLPADRGGRRHGGGAARQRVAVRLPPRSLHLFDAETGVALAHGMERA